MKVTVDIPKSIIDNIKRSADPNVKIITISFNMHSVL